MMKKKKLIPKPPVEQEKVYTTWGYSFQNGGDIPTFEKGGKLQNGVMLYQVGGVAGRKERPGSQYMEVTTTPEKTTGFSYKGTRVDNANVASPYVRGGVGQSQQTIDKNNQAMATIRSKFPTVKTQQDIVRLVNENKIKPYEAQLLLQAIGNERSDALGQTGEFANEYKVDPETGIPFKVSNGRVTMQRNELNKLFQEKAKAGDKRFKGWESLSGDMDYETGVLDKSEGIPEKKPNIKRQVALYRTGTGDKIKVVSSVTRLDQNGNPVGPPEVQDSELNSKDFTSSDVVGLIPSGATSKIYEGAEADNVLKILRNRGTSWNKRGDATTIEQITQGAPSELNKEFALRTLENFVDGRDLIKKIGQDKAVELVLNEINRLTGGKGYSGREADMRNMLPQLESFIKSQLSGSTGTMTR